MAYWAAYVAFSFETNQTRNILKEAKSSLGDLDDYIAWHEPSYLHLTVHFLGWLTENDAKKASKIVNNYDISNIKLQTDGDLTLLGFDKEKEYIALRITPTEELLSLRKKIEFDLQSEGIKVKEQPFLPHISLGRVHNLSEIEKIKLNSRTLSIQKLNIFSSTSSSQSLNKWIMNYHKIKSR